MSVVRDLKDHCFVLATEALDEIVAAFVDEMGRKPSVAELCEILTEGARSHSGHLLVDGPNRSITISGSVQPDRRRRPNTGDLFRVPLSDGNDALIVFLGKFGSFGSAVGILDGRAPAGTLGTKWAPARLLEPPAFIDPEGLETGRWPLAAHRPDLAQR